MNTWGFKTLGKRLTGLWRRFQKWRAMRMYARVIRMELDGKRLFAKANELMAANVPPPMEHLWRKR